MPFSATVYRVLVASPGDVGDEREAIVTTIDSWNALNSDPKKVVLLPVRWESHSAPLLGDRPQAVVNDQIVKDCDLLIGVFWTRLGTPTGVSESGTVEEIEWFLKNRKPVMLYFSSTPVDPRTLDLDQYTALKNFEEKMRKIGLTGSYSNIVDFREKLLQQLSVNVNRLLAGEVAPKMTESEQKKKTAAIEKIVKADTIYMEDYEKNGKVRSFIVKGNTKELKDEFKKLKGGWNPTLGGWVFPKSREIEVAEIIKKYG